MMVVLAFAMKELMAVFQKMHGMDHDIRRPTKAAQIMVRPFEILHKKVCFRIRE
jgi:hypothetical protein